MILYRTTRGIARSAGDRLEILDLPQQDLAGLIATGLDKIATSRVVDTVDLTDVELLAPMDQRGRMVLNGANYVDHVEEAGMPMPKTPLFLEIPDTGLCPPLADLVLPAEATTHVDYEGELALIVTRPGRDIARDNAWDHVGGLAVANDVSARDVQLRGMKDGVIVDLSYVRKGKTYPSFKPIGPGVLVVGEAERAKSFHLRTTVDGEVRQDGHTGEMIFDIPTVIEHVSKLFDLQVGDIILSGTPGGVALATGRYLREGQVVEVSVEGIGTLTNRVVAAE